MGEFAKKHDIYLIADEVYKEFTYDGKRHFSVLQLSGLEDRVIVVDSISKRYSACGARIGAVISRNLEVIKSDHQIRPGAALPADPGASRAPSALTSCRSHYFKTSWPNTRSAAIFCTAS